MREILNCHVCQNGQAHVDENGNKTAFICGRCLRDAEKTNEIMKNVKPIDPLRFQAACAAMTGMVGCTGPIGVADMAVSYADALLERLRK